MKPIPYPKRALASAAMSALALTLVPPASAAEIDTGNPDLSVRLDTTVRFNFAQRVEARDPKIGNSAIADEGTFSFDRDEAVAERLDVLSELDVVWKKRWGARLSATAWRDFAYNATSRSNPNAPFSAIPSYANHVYSNYIQRFYAGPSGEFLDAFAFGGFDVGDVPVQAKLGRHTVYWGESLLLGGNMHSVAYAQNPLDLQKGFATPGVEAKELFRPLNQLSMQAQLSNELSVSGQYMLQWQAFRYPEGGTYLGPVDFAFNGPDRQYISAGLGFATHGAPAEPRQRGEWGLSARWSPDWLDGTVGFYVRDFADKMPQSFITKAAPNASQYNLIYADGIKLYGISLAKSVMGVSVGAEFSVRRNTPLSSQVLGVSPGLPEQGQTKGPRGDTQHALVNALGTVGKTPAFDALSWMAELTWSQYTKVRSGGDLFNAIGYKACAGKDKWDGCTTKSYLGVGLGITPTWYQVLPGLDMSLPFSYSLGLKGNAATVFGGNENMGQYAVGLGFDLQQRYRFDIKYVDFVGAYKDNGTAVTAQNGFTTLLKDRGFLSFTFKTTF